MKPGEGQVVSSALSVLGHCTVKFNRLFYGSSYNIWRILRTRPPGLAQPALPCPAVWLLSPPALTVTQAVLAESPNWVSLCYCFFICGKCRTEDWDRNQKVCSEENKKAWGIWKTSNMFTSTPFSFYLVLCYFKNIVVWKHLKVERLGQSWKDIHWTRFWHQIKVFLPQAWSGLISCVGFKLMQPLSSQMTFWLPAIKNGTYWIFHQPCLYLHILV